MQNDTENINGENLLDVVVLLFKWKKQILWASFLAMLITAGISLTLPNFYEASTQFYAASPDGSQPSPLGNLPDSKNIYGNDQDIDRLISISKSNTIQNFLIDSFNLYEHYDIDKTKSKAKYKLLLKLNKLYKTTKTKYDAVKLSIEDEDPILAASMANATRDKIDVLAQDIIKKSQLNLITSYKRNIDEKQKEYDAIADSLYKIRIKFNVFNTQSQGEAFGSSMVELDGNIQNYSARIRMLKNMDDIPPDSIGIMEAKLAGFKNQFVTLKKNIDDYNNGYPHILRYERELKDFGDQLNLDKERLKQLEAVYNSSFNSLHVTEKAEEPVIKSRPKRSYIVIGVGLLSFVLMSLWVMLQDQMNKNNWRSKFRNA